MRVPSFGQLLLVVAGALALWSSTCFFAPAPRGNPTRQGERLALVPGARWEFDLADWEAELGLAILSLRSESEQAARITVRVEQEGSEPRISEGELRTDVGLGIVGYRSRVAVELTAYEGPPAWGSAYVWNFAGDRYVAWSLGRSGGMFGFLVAALCAGFGMLLIWRRPKSAGEAPTR